MSDIIPEGILYGNLGVGSGTTNYNDLDNKPQINSVTLQGNKTASELGLVGTADIPVTSVNGETGAVVLDGTEINYQTGKTINQKIDEVEAEIPVVSYPVTSVNGETGAVVLDGTDIEYSSGVSVNSQIDTLMNYIPVYGNTASGAIATFDTSLALPLQDLQIAINGTNLTGAYIGYVDFNQLRRDDTTTNTADGITTKYDGTSHLVSITNNSRTTNYSSGSTQITLSSTAPIENHVYAYLANTDEQGISISQTNGNTLRQTDIINTVFKGVSGATGFRLRITNLYDFVSAHPINNTFSFYLNIIDLTQAFGETLAEYLYSLTDHGISIVKQIFTKDYYAYNAGGTKVSIESVNGTPYPNAYVSWNDLGTVSEGSLDVTTGKLTVVNGSMGAGEYQITPIPINQLSGTNNIFCDTGDTSVVYACSLKDYIDSQ